MYFLLVVSTIIVYGLTLIIVQGTIFNGLRKRLAKYIDKVERELNPKAEDVLELIEASHKSINPKLLKIYNELLGKIDTTTGDDPKFDTLMTMFDDTKAKIKACIINKRKTYFKTFDLWIALKLQKLGSCMMCMGFWVGLFVCVMSLAYSISICGVPFDLVTSLGTHEMVITSFLLACMFSGTTWAINAVVDTLDEIKGHLGDIISKR